MISQSNDDQSVGCNQEISNVKTGVVHEVVWNQKTKQFEGRRRLGFGAMFRVCGSAYHVVPCLRPGFFWFVSTQLVLQLGFKN